MGKSQHLLAEQSPNSGFGDNPLIFNQTPDLAFGHSVADPIISGQFDLLNKISLVILWLK
ncbi:hypothetical protein XBFM1_1730012 [Xenorhabdus bovienii str. feltiae Moldova]|uniref:Uncharacterized protein n=1 Tax=Xenorhabdus bovienii str. feltiae Moldova TaxID=1398200 RepID=A0A077NQ05_XENBV|nr:hypothetical protein XBFM1_1730012 [Xenorhabdus bovienii str. feltiae Moldova]